MSGISRETKRWNGVTNLGPGPKVERRFSEIQVRGWKEGGGKTGRTICH